MSFPMHLMITFQQLEPNLLMRCPLSAYRLYGNFGKHFPSYGTGIFFGTENRNGIELYHLQNVGKFFALSLHEAWH